MFHIYVIPGCHSFLHYFVHCCRGVCCDFMLLRCRCGSRYACVFWCQKNAMASAADNHMTTSVTILDEELRSKIEENARLHKQVKI